MDYEQQEQERLRESIERLEQLIAMTGRKLADKDFVARAPQPIVDKERGRLAEFSAAKQELEEQLKRR